MLELLVNPGAIHQIHQLQLYTVMVVGDYERFYKTLEVGQPGMALKLVQTVDWPVGVGAKGNASLPGFNRRALAPIDIRNMATPSKIILGSGYLENKAGNFLLS